MTSFLDIPLMWKCDCGERMFNHYEHCSGCGKAKPEPVAKQPDDTEPLSEVVG